MAIAKLLSLLVGVEHLLYCRNGNEAQEAEERHLDHDTRTHCQLLEHTHELVLLWPVSWCVKCLSL